LQQRKIKIAMLDNFLFFEFENSKNKRERIT